MDAPKLKLRRLKIVRFRNVAPGCELLFDDGVNVLLGKNGTGKTTLLALISCVVRSDFSTFANEPFELEYDLGPEPLIVVRIQHEAVGEVADIVSGATLLHSRWQAHVDTPHGVLTIESDDDARVLARIDTRAVDLPGRTTNVYHALEVAQTVLQLAPEESFLDRSPPFSAMFRFDEALDAFRAMLGAATPPLGVACPPAARSTAFMELWYGRYVPPAFFRLSKKLEDRFEVVFSEDHSGSLDLCGWCSLLGFSSIVWIADLPEGPPENRHFTRFAFRLLRHDGSALSHEHLSYGQKRMLALLYYMACNPQVLIADEVVNGLHHEWIAAVMERIRDRQAFLTSQNPLLFDYLSVDSADRAGRMFLLCSAEQDERGKTTVTWRNMDPEEAARFHEDLAAGVEYPSEVLLRRGLW
ncbi:MAG: AAA family ATPase [Planctomycetota bacterium]|nr:AAA family ATPase [Planctomycetota bacterium]